MIFNQLNRKTQLVYWTMVTIHLMKMLHAATKELMTWCNAYETFCLFHDNSKENVHDLSAAQKRCNDSRQGSWPLEIADKRIEGIIDEFINKSITDVILNSVLKDTKWYWIKENKTIQDSFILSVFENIRIYAPKSGHEGFAVICMTDCKAEWFTSNLTTLNAKGEHFTTILDEEECRDMCERDANCTSVAFTYFKAFQGCWVYRSKFDKTQLTITNGTNHHLLISRAGKTPKRCIFGQREPIISKGMGPLYSILLVLSIAVILIISIAFGIKHKTRLETSERKLSVIAKS